MTERIENLESGAAKQSEKIKKLKRRVKVIRKENKGKMSQAKSRVDSDSDEEGNDSSI